MAAAISKVPLLLQPRTKAFFVLWSIVSLFLFLYHGVPALRYHLFQPSSARTRYDFTEGLFDNGLLTAVGTSATTADGAATVAFTVPSLSSSSRENRIADALRHRNVTVHLVLATQARDDVSWADRLRIPGAADLRVIRYVADAPDAPYRPPVLNKGREALMYMTYLHDFYDELPDVAILVHAEDYAWHAEPALGTSMRIMLSRFDLREVLDGDGEEHGTQNKKKEGRRVRLVNSRASSGQNAIVGDRDSGFNTGRRGYANLRTSWLNACPDWINTTKTPEESVKQEEPYMREAFLANFGPASFPGDDAVFLQQQKQEEVPEILAGTCCSQFAVSRSAVRSRPRAQYKRSMDFLATTPWSDYIAGRTWEHLWPFLFRGAARDCPVEWKALCRMYGVCFPGGAAEQAAWMDRWRERERLREPLEFWQELGHPVVAARARARMRELGDWLRKGLAVAVRRGEVGREGVGNVYEFQ